MNQKMEISGVVTVVKTRYSRLLQEDIYAVTVQQNDENDTTQLRAMVASKRPVIATVKEGDILKVCGHWRKGVNGQKGDFSADLRFLAFRQGRKFMFFPFANPCATMYLCTG